MSNKIFAYKGITPTLGERVFIHDTAFVNGDVVIGDDSSVWPTAVLRGDTHRIRIGSRTSIQDGSILHTTHASDFNPGGWPLTIGDQVTVGHRTVLHGCTIHDRVLVGNGAIIMDGAVVESEVIVGAGCMVPPNKRLESGYVYTGNPVKQGRPLKPSEKTFFDYTSDNYVKLKTEYIENS